MKAGVENYTFWSEKGSGYGEPGGTHPLQEFPGVPPTLHSPPEHKQTDVQLEGDKHLLDFQRFLKTLKL